jgi:hypothetical protein
MPASSLVQPAPKQASSCTVPCILTDLQQVNILLEFIQGYNEGNHSEEEVLKWMQQVDSHDGDTTEEVDWQQVDEMIDAFINNHCQDDAMTKLNEMVDSLLDNGNVK